MFWGQAIADLIGDILVFWLIGGSLALVALGVLIGALVF